MEAPEHIQQGLANIREGMHLRWNRKAVLLKAGITDAIGKVIDPEYDPRWEVWDTSPEGEEYMVMRVQEMDGSFRPPGEWLVHSIGKCNPERYGGDVQAMLDALVEEPDALREIGTKKDSDDLIEAVAKWCQYVVTPKSGPGIKFRGQRMMSAGGKGR